MYYPWWYVPHLTSPMLIAAIAVIHVLVSHYAVGGGLFLAVETRYAYRTNDRDYLGYLRRHAQFFVLLTVAFGAITGVGIWWTIGLASPLATEVLIRTFVFGWATEWVFFVIEILAAFAFYYYWGRLDAKTHQAMGWIYGIAAWISLVLITGITAFMLSPGRWIDDHNFWSGFFNPQFWPQVISRTGGTLLLSALYVYLHSSIVAKDKRLHDLLARRSTRPALLGGVMILAGGALWLLLLPPSALAVLESAAVLTVLTVLLFALTAIVLALFYLGPYRNPSWLSPGFAGTMLLFGIAAFSTGEFIREAVRKPYIIYNVVLGNQVMVEEVDKVRSRGFLESGKWTKPYVERHYPTLVVNGSIDESRMLTLDRADRVKLGEVLFQYHCNDCHAVKQGYSAVGPLLRGRNHTMIRDLIGHMDQAPFFMPPWCGTPEEADLLTDYLATIAPPRPAGMRPKPNHSL